MSNVDWDHWLNMPTVKVWQACALSMDFDPHKCLLEGSRLESWEWEVDQSKFRKRVTILVSHIFDTDNFPNAVRDSLNANSVIHLNDFVDWTLKVKWDVPKELETIVATKEKVEDKLYREDKPNVEPWRGHREGDPKPKHDWYTPARYFARELVRDDSNLLTKKKYLYQKISDSLADVGIYKRGGKKAFDSQTIRKALANIKYN
jgi:hypothetical protein